MLCTRANLYYHVGNTNLEGAMNLKGRILKSAHDTVNYLYPIKEDVSPEVYQAIATLRQLINEEFVGKNKTVSSQFIYDILKGVL